MFLFAKPNSHWIVPVPSVKVTVGVLHAAVAVAEPRAALISEADGLQPSVATAPVIIIVGGLGPLVHVTVLEAVEVLPQASTCSKCSCLRSRARQLLYTAPSARCYSCSAAGISCSSSTKCSSNIRSRWITTKRCDSTCIVITGGVRSAIHVTVLEVVAVLPQASLQ